MANDQFGNHKNWVVDFRASHHTTFDLQNLSIHSKYGANENIVVGNGKMIFITNISSTTLNSPTTTF